MARGGRVSLGQPDVKGHEARLRSEANDGQNEQQTRMVRNRLDRRGASREFRRSRVRPQQRKHRQQEQRSQVRGHKVRPARLTHFLVLVLECHKEERGQRHDLPRHEEQHDIARGGDQDHAGNQEAEEEPGCAERLAITIRTQVLDAVDGCQSTQQEDRDEEERGQRVQLNVK